MLIFVIFILRPPVTYYRLSAFRKRYSKRSTKVFRLFGRVVLNILSIRRLSVVPKLYILLFGNLSKYILPLRVRVILTSPNIYFSFFLLFFLFFY